MDVVLALGGGGAKCFAQIGALGALEAAGVRVRAVACTSAGALVGAPFADGVPVGAILDALRSAQGRPPRRARRGDGLFDPRAGLEAVDALVGDRTFADLRIPLALTAVDLETGEALALDAGALRPALHAAVAIPGLFPPVRLGERPLADGGVVDPVPVGLARRLAPGLPAVAVAIAPPHGRWSEHRLPQRLAGLPLARLAARWRPARALDAFLRASDLTHRRLLEARLALEGPEILVRPDVPVLDVFQAVDVDALVRAGARAAEEALASLGGG